MSKGSVQQYMVRRVEDDSALTPVSHHEGIASGVAAGRHMVEVEDFDFCYALYCDGVRLASFADGRLAARGWAPSRAGVVHRSRLFSLQLVHSIH